MATTNKKRSTKFEAFQPEKVIIIAGNEPDLLEFNSCYKYPNIGSVQKNEQKLHSEENKHPETSRLQFTDNGNDSQLTAIKTDVVIGDEQVKNEILEDDFSENDDYREFPSSGNEYQNTACINREGINSPSRYSEEYDNEEVDAYFTDNEDTDIIMDDPALAAAEYSWKINRLDESMREIFSCRMCSFRTLYFYRLRVHFWTHQSEESLAESIFAFENSHTALYNMYLLRPNTLDALDKSLGRSFLTKSSNHSAELVCSRCSYKTNEKINLKDHILTHIEEKPFYGKLSPVVIIKPSNLDKSRSTDRHMESPVFEDESLSDTMSTDEPINTYADHYIEDSRDGIFHEAADDEYLSSNTSCEVLLRTAEENNSVTDTRRSTKGASDECVVILTGDEGRDKGINRKMHVPNIILPLTKVKRLSDKLREIKELNKSLLDSNIVSKSHLASSHEGPFIHKNYFSCDSCSYRTMHKINIRKHMITHEKHPSSCETYPYLGDADCVDRTVFACSLCPYQAVSNEHLKIHLVRHKKRRLLACNYCTYRSFFEDNLQSHNCKPVNFYCCDICPYKTRKDKNLKRHAIIHSDVKPFACKVCPFRTKYLSSLNSHSAAHSGTQRYSCDQCTFKTNKMYNLTEHMLIHTGGKKYLCDICSYQSIKQSSFKSHLLKHTGEKPHTCHLCSFKTSAKCTLRRHIKNVHKNGRKITKQELD